MPRAAATDRPRPRPSPPQGIRTVCSRSCGTSFECRQVHTRRRTGRGELAPGDSRIELAFADTGSGIRADFLPRVRRFRQADPSPTREHGGLGLGLAIVRHLVDRARRHRRRRRQCGGAGQTFTVRLPLTAGQGARMAAAPASEPRLRLSGLHVLVVDDQEDAREIAGKMLEDQGAAVTTARSACGGVRRSCPVPGPTCWSATSACPARTASR